MSRALGEALRRAREEKGIKVKDLAAWIGISGPSISQWESGQTEPKGRNYAKACEHLGIDPSQFLGLFDDPPSSVYLTEEPADLTGGIDKLLASISTEEPERHGQVKTSFMRRKPWPPSSAAPGTPLARDVPVYGIAVGGEDGDFELNGQEIDRVQRPAALASVAGLFAIYLSNDSMYPAWKEGSLIFVAPHRQPRKGDDVIIQLKGPSEGGAGKAFLKRLVSRRQDIITVEQFNPKKEIAYSMKEVSAIFRVIPYDEALGIS